MGFVQFCKHNVVCIELHEAMLVGTRLIQMEQKSIHRQYRLPVELFFLLKEVLICFNLNTLAQAAKQRLFLWPENAFKGDVYSKTVQIVS